MDEPNEGAVSILVRDPRRSDFIVNIEFLEGRVEWPHVLVAAVAKYNMMASSTSRYVPVYRHCDEADGGPRLNELPGSQTEVSHA
jgi:hypothetical protein